jgi:hypothetical protein
MICDETICPICNNIIKLKNKIILFPNSEKYYWSCICDNHHERYILDFFSIQAEKLFLNGNIIKNCYIFYETIWLSPLINSPYIKNIIAINDFGIFYSSIIYIDEFKEFKFNNYINLFKFKDFLSLL